MSEIEELKNSPEFNALGITEILYKVSRSLRELEQVVTPMQIYKLDVNTFNKVEIFLHGGHRG
jgi:hypothetical protein